MLQEAEPPLREALGPALAGGKRLRPALTLLVHDACGGLATERALRYAVAVELTHCATLIHDDLVDGDDVRRGRPALHARLRDELRAKAARPDARTSPQGLAALAADAAFAWGFSLLDPPGAERICRALRATWLGAWHEALPATGPGHERVAELKTGSLFRAACELGALAAGAQGHLEAAGDYGARVGLAYQMADDALDGPPGAPPRDVLLVRARGEAALAAKLAGGFPRAGPREALEDAPRALLAAMLGREARP